MSLGELAAFICTHLQKHDIHCVLTGGACVSIYTENRYQSLDLDFIENMPTKRTHIVDVLHKIGFVEKNRYFKHPDTPYFIEFPTGPLAIGKEPIKKTNSLEFSTGQLRLLTPTDCAKDRLAAYYYWNDKECLQQTIMICENQKVDINEIERWSKAENKLSEFKSIRSSLIKKH